VRRDRVVKMQLYARYGVKEYWIVDPEEKLIDVYKLQNRTFKLANRFGYTDKLVSSLLPNFSCSLKTIFS
jgi:Uma2 family endonuclease